MRAADFRSEGSSEIGRPAFGQTTVTAQPARVWFDTRSCNSPRFSHGNLMGSR